MKKLLWACCCCCSRVGVRIQSSHVCLAYSQSISHHASFPASLRCFHLHLSPPFLFPYALFPLSLSQITQHPIIGVSPCGTDAILWEVAAAAASISDSHVPSLQCDVTYNCIRFHVRNCWHNQIDATYMATHSRSPS